MISNILEDLTGNVFTFKSSCMDEMAEIASSAPCRTMEVSAGHCSVITLLNELVRIYNWIQRLLGKFDLVCFFKLADFTVGQLDKLVMIYLLVLSQK